MTLNRQQIRALRAESHRLKLKPVVIVGQHGLSENVSSELKQALEHHELIKIRIPALDKAERSELIESLRQQLGAELIHAIGHVLVLFLKKPKKSRFEVLLRG